MMIGTVEYCLNRANEVDIYNHLLAGEDDFVRTLTQRVNLTAYCRKIYDKAVKFEAWADGELVGLAAIYCNDQAQRMAYITSVSVLNRWQGQGIASQLMGRCIQYAEKQGMSCIRLEVSADNLPAIRLYKKCGFRIADDGDSLITMSLLLKGKKPC